MNTNTITTHQEQSLLDKIRSLSPEKKTELEDFVNFLHYKSEDHRLASAAIKMSEKLFGEVWDNPEDAEYDKL
jgi:hypothetical protein